MYGIGPIELIILAVLGVGILAALIILLLAAIRILRSPPKSAAAVAIATPSVSHQDLLRTRYFSRPTNAPRRCPRCTAPLPLDAPEGLCPACLLAGGLEEHALPPTSSGHATPPGAEAIDASQLAAAFPHLEIMELLGQGGMGTVLKVRQKNLDRLAALKVIPPQAALDPSFAERFAREARALARLNHASIVTVYDFGQTGGFYFLLMEFVDGLNLRQLMQAERIAPREALAIVPQICDALQYAHDQGIVHRDIKPENVLIDRTGRVKIADFGLAKLLGANPAEFTLTHTQQVMGTPRYMAPEQIERPLEVDHRADIYSLGVVIYEMLTGELPIGRFAPPSQKAPIDVRLDDIVLRTLEKEPQRRYQQVSQVKTELESVGHVAAAPTKADESPERRHAAALQAIEQTQVLARLGATPPLGIVLAVAIGMVLGMLMMGAGLALAATPFVVPGNLNAWPFIGAGIGTLIGGAGSFLGSYNAYRQLAGAVDLMNSPEITWFDYVLLAYGALGLLTMIPGIQGLLFDPNEEHVYPMLLIGGIVSFQALLVVLWRWGARQKGNASGEPAVTKGHSAPKLRPAFMPAVVVPTLLLAAVWLILFLNFRFLSGHWPQTVEHIMDSAPGGARKLRTIIGRDEPALSLVLAAIGGVSTLCVFLGLTFWRLIGPRRANGDGSLAVAAPFGHPAWAVVIVVASFATFLIPWVRLSLDPVVQEPDFAVNLLHQTAYSGSALREITGMPRGERYTTLGYRNIGGAAAAILAGVGVLLAAGLASTHLALRRATSITGVAVAFLAALILAAFLHQIGERQESLVLDGVTQRGLVRSFSSVESAPSGIVAEFIDVAPGPGLYLAAAMTALLLLVGATQWAWSSPDDAAMAADDAALPDKPQKWPTAQREAALAHVRGPGMGLIVSGVLGLAPIVLFCVAIPLSWAVLLPVQTLETRPEPDAVIERTGAATVIPLPLASIGVLAPPVLLAQEGPPMGGPDLTVWGLLAVTFGAVVLLAALPSSILLILGGVKMRQLQSYGLARFAAIVALLPLGPHWLISLPMGIWALAVLGRPEVKGAFE